MTPIRHAFFTGLIALAGSFLSAAERPAIVGLEVFPPKLELNGARDARRVIVSGKDAEGRLYDLSSEAKLAAAGPQVGIDRDGFIEPKVVGESKVTVTAAAASAFFLKN